MYRAILVVALCYGLFSIVASPAKKIGSGLHVAIAGSSSVSTTTANNVFLDRLWTQAFTLSAFLLPVVWYLYFSATRNAATHVKAYKTVAFSVSCGILLSLAINLFVWLWLRHSSTGAKLFPALSSIADLDIFTVLGMITYLLLAPLVEEMVYRGLAYEFMLAASPGTRFAVCVVPFAISHGSTGGAVHVLTSFVLGTLFYLVRVYGGHILYPVSAHVANNCTTFVLT